MNKRIQLLCAWSLPVATLPLLVGFWPLAGFVPPPPAHDSAREIANFYRGDTDTIRLGLAIVFLSLMAWGPFVAVMTRQLLRIDPDGAKGSRHNVLAYAQLSAGTLGWVFLTVPVLILEVAAFRPDRSPDVTQAIHDLGWILLIMPVVPFCVACVSIGLAALSDPSDKPVFPRWVGYFNVWAALLFTPGVLVAFFKTGAFSYQGAIAFWMPFVVFFAWIFVMAVVLGKAIRGEPSEA